MQLISVAPTGLDDMMLMPFTSAFERSAKYNDKIPVFPLVERQGMFVDLLCINACRITVLFNLLAGNVVLNS